MSIHSIRDRMKVIQTTQELAEACAAIAQHEFVAVDTEFLR